MVHRASDAKNCHSNSTARASVDMMGKMGRAIDYVPQLSLNAYLIGISEMWQHNTMEMLLILTLNSMVSINRVRNVAYTHHLVENTYLNVIQQFINAKLLIACLLDMFTTTTIQTVCRWHCHWWCLFGDFNEAWGFIFLIVFIIVRVTRCVLLAGIFSARFHTWNILLVHGSYHNKRAYGARRRRINSSNYSQLTGIVLPNLLWF